ncbi:MAG: hypothetical protein HC810_02655 [Acaryochloridaceae cyanobacterium RL_2_7]|nr:hypothetical protein [Acaryochloridaceae cyanobacterium RL_2_7]
MASSKRSALGNNPLNQGIFTKTEGKTEIETPTTSLKKQTVQTNQDSIKKKKEARFLKSQREEKVNLRLSIKINDWLDSLLKKGKRKHGKKISKEVWVQAALELFQSMPVNWEEIDSEERLAEELRNIESRIKNLDS